MSTPDITALFDNLLENAFEAAVLSEEKQIDFSVYIRNRNFQIIRLVNSCSYKPEIIEGKLRSKKKAPLHGIGTKSIKRVVRKYDGEVDMNFNERNYTFECVVMLHIIEK